MYKEKIKKYIEENGEKIISELMELVKIPSVSSDYEACTRVIEKIEELYRENGFRTELCRDKEYLLSYLDRGKRTIGLFAHADVVSADDSWTVTPAFEPKIYEGALFGRGASDDKSAVIISLYALKIIKELNIPFDSTLLCFTGVSEENTMNDIKNYAESNTLPDFSLVLDAGFPVYYGDKGMLWLYLTLNSELEDLISIDGGNAINIILGEARARVRYKKSLFDELCRCSDISVSKNGEEIEIYAKGISSHGAMPYGSKNAAGMILKSLTSSPSFSENDKKSLDLIVKTLLDYTGDTLGIKSYDERFGDLTVTNGIFKTENGRISFSLDIRFGQAGFDIKSLLSAINKAIDGKEITYEIKKQGEAHYLDTSSKYVQACMRAYSEYTGDYKSLPRINAGGTYSRYLDSSAEVGTTLIWKSVPLPEGHGEAHQRDENISVQGLLKALELIVNMLIECDRQ